MDSVSELARLNVLLEIVADWAQATERAEVIGSIKRLRWVIEFDRCFTVLYGPEPAALEVFQFLADSTRTVSLEAATPTTRQLIARALETRRSAVDDPGRIMAMCHPLVTGETVLGALCFESASSPYALRDYRLAHFIGESFAGTLDRIASRTAEREANRLKDEFLALLGHELRNPLAPITTGLALMNIKLANDSATQRERSIIARQLKQMTRLLDDLLDISRVTRGKIELRTRPIEIAEVVDQAVEMSAPVFEERRHDLEITVPRSGLVVEADPARLAQVITNLLTNAAKYTEPEGTVTISGTRRGGEIQLSVKDTGRGIATDALERFFEPFVQGERTEGLGLGLAIARRLADLHGGSLAASSPGVGQGSEFVLRLPACAVPVPARVLPVAPRSPVRTRTGTILLVDDNENASEMLAELLRTLGYEVRAATDGPKALALAEHLVPTVAILDIGLPVMDGYELARRLRGLLGKTPFLIALTGYGQEADRARSWTAGFDLHFAKPVDVDALVAALDEQATKS